MLTELYLFMSVVMSIVEKMSLYEPGSDVSSTISTVHISRSFIMFTIMRLHLCMGQAGLKCLKTCHLSVSKY